MMQNSKISIYDAEQSLTHSSLMDVALQYLEGVGIRINTYFRKQKSLWLSISAEIY